MQPNVSPSEDLGLTAAPQDAGRGLAGPPTRSIRVPGPARRVEVKVAATRDELEQAFRLLAHKYQARGYEVPGPKPFRFTPYHVLPGTTTFVARHDAAVVATLSLVPDTPILGLPLEGVYGPEVARLRREGRRVGELTCLAGQDLSPVEFLRVFTALLRLALQHHVRHGGDSWVITIHPRHATYYRKVLGFVPLGPRRSYPAVQGHPAEAYFLDAALLRANAPAMHREILGTAVPEAVLTAPGRPGDHARHFADHSTQTDRRTLLDLLQRVERQGGVPRWRQAGRIAA
jgi:hypothetical protein